ncbi:MAG: hypothetical protein QGG17_07950, partial [Rhodospirillales bacterium]|nr:hypothetical protein [Rhodospirillales bacterium]
MSPSLPPSSSTRTRVRRHHSAGVSAEALVRLDHALALDRQFRAQTVVRRVGERDHRIEPVVAAL